MGSPVFILGDMKTDILKQNNLSSTCSILLQYNGMTQLPATATWLSIDSATVINHVFHNHILDNPDCGILHGGFIDHCSYSVKKFQSLLEKYVDTETTYNVFPFLYIENATQLNLEFFSKKLKLPNLSDGTDRQFEMFFL